MQSSLSVNELQLAENYWIRMVQRQHFPVEITSLKSGKSLPPSSSLQVLCPVLDEEEIFRSRGHQSIYKSIHHIILHGSHTITRMIIREKHHRLMHGGLILVHSSISRRFHIIGHKVFQSVIWECIAGRRYSAKPEIQRMGDLPNSKVDVTEDKTYEKEVKRNQLSEELKGKSEDLSILEYG